MERSKDGAKTGCKHDCSYDRSPQFSEIRHGLRPRDRTSARSRRRAARGHDQLSARDDLAVRGRIRQIGRGAGRARDTGRCGLAQRRRRQGLPARRGQGTGGRVLVAVAADLRRPGAQRRFPQKLDIDRTGLPGRIGRQNISDPEGFYEATEVAGYGLVVNPAYLQKAGLAEPREWEDLARPEYAGHITMPVPGKIGFAPGDHRGHPPGLWMERRLGAARGHRRQRDAAGGAGRRGVQSRGPGRKGRGRYHRLLRRPGHRATAPRCASSIPRPTPSNRRPSPFRRKRPTSRAPWPTCASCSRKKDSGC